MTAVFLIAIVIFGFLLILNLSPKGSHSDIKIHKNRHGHRCFIDGLNSSEKRIVSLLSRNLDHNKYFIFNNLYLPSEYSNTTQVDHVVVSRYGIFVIETKNHSGWIYAHSNRKEWTQTFKNRKKYKIYNPIFQNYGHVSALKAQLHFLGNRIHNVVVFSGPCEFKAEKPKNVLYEHELIDFIKSKDEIVLKEVELMVVVGKLSMLCQVTDVTEEEHAENVAQAIEAKSVMAS